MVRVPLIVVAVNVLIPLKFVMLAVVIVAFVAVRLPNVPTLVILGWAAVVRVPLMLVAVSVPTPLKFVMFAVVIVAFVAVRVPSVPTLVILG